MFEALKNWYLRTTKPQTVSFQTMFLASLFAKGNVLLTQLVGAALVGVALLLGDTWSGAFTKFAIWQLFVVGLCALAARGLRYFSFVEFDQNLSSINDRLILAGMNFILVSVWATTFLDPRLGMLLSAGYSMFTFFLFTPSKAEKQGTA